MKTFKRLLKVGQLLSRATELIFHRGSDCVSFEPMWFLECDRDEIRKRAFSPKAEKAIFDILDNGFAILPKNVDEVVCGAVIEDFNRFVRDSVDAKRYRDEYGFHERLCNLQLVSEAARNVCFNEGTAEVIRAAFDSPFTVAGSLYFEKGSMQSVHRDTPAFFTNPLNHYFGVWNALEDVKKGSGPLVYYAGGHKLLADKSLYLDSSVTVKTYFRVVEDACKDAGLDLVEYYPSSGDTLIWHPQLPHGGAPILNNRISRRSLVFHAIPRGIPIYGTKEFFDPEGVVPLGKKYRVIKYGKNDMIDQGEPRFFHNRYEGNFGEV